MMQDKIRLAVADDHIQFRRAVTSHLERQGFDVTLQAENGAHLLSLLENTSPLPDVCLVDIHMPVMEGTECISLIRRHWPEIIPVAMSIDNTAETEQRAKAAGAAAYVVKGGDPLLLKAIIESSIRKRDA